MALEGGFLQARVTHTRLLPKHHHLDYSVFYLCLPLSKISILENRFLSRNKFNLLSFYDSDHGKKSSDLSTWIRAILSEWQITNADGEIVLLTMPRILGYVFNPVSFWFCFDKESNLRAVLSEVNNTFGERHCYLNFHSDLRPIRHQDKLTSKKVFHVSPFLDVRGEYTFKFDYSESKIGVWISYSDEQNKILTTSLVGHRLDATSKNSLKLFFKNPLVTIKVITSIHLHAIKLLIKGMRFYKKPKPPIEDVTL